MNISYYLLIMEMEKCILWRQFTYLNSVFSSYVLFKVYLPEFYSNYMKMTYIYILIFLEIELCVVVDRAFGQMISYYIDLFFPSKSKYTK